MEQAECLPAHADARRDNRRHWRDCQIRRRIARVSVGVIPNVAHPHAAVVRMYVASTAPSSPVHRRRPVEGPRPRMHAEVRAGTMHDRPRTEARTRTMTETRTGGGTKTWARTTKARAARTRSHTRTSVGPRKRSPRKRCANNARNHQFFGHFLHFPPPLLFVSVGDSPLVMLGTVPRYRGLGAAEPKN